MAKSFKYMISWFFQEYIKLYQRKKSLRLGQLGGITKGGQLGVSSSGLGNFPLGSVDSQVAVLGRMLFNNLYILLVFYT